VHLVGFCYKKSQHLSSIWQSHFVSLLVKKRITFCWEVFEGTVRSHLKLRHYLLCVCLCVFPLRTVLYCRPLKEIRRSGFYTCALTMACHVINDSRWIIVLFGSYSDIRRELLVHSKPVRNDIAVSCIPYTDNVIWSTHFN